MNLSLSCPTCHQPLIKSANNSLICAHTHQFGYENDVLVLLDGVFKQQLDTFLTKFEPLREAEAKRLLDTAVYESLPFAPELQTNPEWRMRCYDVNVMDRLLYGQASQSILEIGAWNGWLSNHLTKQGHRVTAVDYFTDEYDGLRAKRYYQADWQTIQMDLTDLSVLNSRFDVVILNRCVQFFLDPVGYALAAKEKVAPSGLLILTGLSFFQNVSLKAEAVAVFHHHLRQHGIQNIKPMKGYLDFEDKRQLEAAQIALRPYAQLWRANLKSRFKKSAPRYFYGVYKANN